MNPLKLITDAERQLLLGKLIDSELLLTEWEQTFVSGYRRAASKPSWFTDGRRQACDEMRMRYGMEPEIAMPMPTLETGPRPAPADADPDGCEFLMTVDGGMQQRCNAPAVLQRRNGFRYCQSCADRAQMACRRVKTKLELYPFSSKG